MLNWLPTEEEKPVSLQRPMAIGETIGWKALTAELPKTLSPRLGVQCRSNDAITVTK